MHLAQVAQHAGDLERSIRCYEVLLGQPPSAVFEVPGLAFFSLGTTRLLLDASAPSSLLYLQVGDVKEEVERLRGLDFEIVSEPHVIFRHETDDLGHAGEDEWMAFVRDSESNLVGLVSHVPTESATLSVEDRWGDD